MPVISSDAGSMQVTCPGVHGLAAGVEQEHSFDKEEDQAGEDHAGSDQGGPGEAEVVRPVNGSEDDASEEEEGADPAAKAGREVEVAGVARTAQLADGSADEAVVVVDAAAQVGAAADFVRRAGFRLSESGEDGAEGSGRERFKAGVEHGVFAGHHALVPGGGMYAPVEEEQCARSGHVPSLTAIVPRGY